jgi:hypothetical protein
MDKDTGELLTQFEGHKNSDFKVDSALSYDDAMVISGSEDGTVVMWDLVSGRELHRAREHPAVVCSVSCHPRRVSARPVHHFCTVAPHNCAAAAVDLQTITRLCCGLDDPAHREHRRHRMRLWAAGRRRGTHREQTDRCHALARHQRR